MSGHHSEKTKLLGFFADVELVARVDQARRKLGMTRSQFLRESVVQFLQAHGVDVPPELRMAPDRTGKGGRKKKKPNLSSYGIDLDQLGKDLVEAAKWEEERRQKKKKKDEGSGGHGASGPGHHTGGSTAQG